MKKIFTLTALPLCALLAFGACANRTDTPSEPADPSSTQVSVQELTEAREHAGALKAELDEMNQLLQIEQTEKQALSDRVDELEDALAAALEGKEGSETPDNNEDEPFLERALANGATLIYRAGVSDGPVYSEHLADEMKVRYADAVSYTHLDVYKRQAAAAQGIWVAGRLRLPPQPCAGVIHLRAGAGLAAAVALRVLRAAHVVDAASAADACRLRLYGL